MSTSVFLTKWFSAFNNESESPSFSAPYVRSLSDIISINSLAFILLDPFSVGSFRCDMYAYKNMYNFSFFKVNMIILYELFCHCLFSPDNTPKRCFPIHIGLLYSFYWLHSVSWYGYAIIYIPFPGFLGSFQIFVLHRVLQGLYMYLCIIQD